MEEYTPLRISTIKPESSLGFDLFIHFKETYLCYAKQGNSLPADIISKLKKQKVARFFINASDEVKYQEYLDKILNETLDDPDIPVEDKAAVAEGAAGTAVEQIQKDPTSEVAYQMTEMAAIGLRKIINSNPESVKIIFEKEGAADDNLVVKHSLNVSLLSTKLAEIEGLEEETLDNIATAGLLHDIGVSKLPGDFSSLFSKPREDFTDEERKEYNTHPEITAELFKEKEYINDDILTLIRNHEENLSGSGPLKMMKLTKAEEIISLVDTFDILVTVSKLTAKDAMKQLQVDQLGNYDLELIQKFKKVVKDQGIT